MRCERRHRKDCGHIGGRTPPELMIMTAFIGVVAACVVPGILADFHKGKVCVDLLARGGAGACPVTKKAYPPGESVTCDPEHLPSKPVFLRAGGPPEQTLPAPYDGRPVDIQPSFPWRWLAAPVILISLGLAIFVFCKMCASHDPRVLLMALVSIGVAGAGIWFCLASAASSESVEAAPGRIVHRRWLLGAERSPRVLEGVTAVVPVKVSGRLQAVAIQGRAAVPLTFVESMEDVARLDARVR